ncbi:GGDEF domain-containing protein [Actinophytocola oryzae]|uniref:Diguanylate cyclase (GGDEF)-like protein n=1 Tax=Actinophytocola oryzae TaxID=502181 RepID=A0A4R7VV91_9PSEU|nr:GGDEF domain-containing protein [Actinophytocola oryzae]TDV53923.1 diguanylate cyclase (GGDEF)-like protein [Actinophytocola oryzae]
MGELGRGRPGLVARWCLWRLPRRVLLVVLAVHIAAAGSVLGTAWLFPAHRHHWIIAAALVGLAAVHLEWSRRLGPPCPGERAVPYTDLKTVWNVAAVLLVPPPLAALVVVMTHAYGYLRVHRQDDRRAHRWVYTCSTVVLASQAAGLVLAMGTDTYPGIPGPGQFEAWLVVFAAVVVRWAVDYLLVVTVSALVRGSFAHVVTRMGEQVNEAAAGALAVVVAVLLENGYVVLLGCVYLVVGVLQQTSYYHHWKRERPFDPLTRVYSRASFIEQARRILARSETVGCLLLDLDYFKRINDTHGHNVGDQALVAVAEAIRQEVRKGRDVPARWGGEEFVVLVPEVTMDSLTRIAERVRLRVRATEVVYIRRDSAAEDTSTCTVRMTASIGVALRSAQDENLLDLVERADRLMYAAKAAGRDQVCSTLPPQRTSPVTDYAGDR